MNAQDRDRLLAALREAPERIARLTAGLRGKAVRAAPPGAEFSVVGNVCHLRDIEIEGFTVRIERLLREEAPRLPDVDGAKLARERAYDTRDLSAELAAFRTARGRSLALLGALAPASEAWRRGGTLETVGPITLDGLVGRMVEHDRGHLEEIERIAGASRGRRPIGLSIFVVLLGLANLGGLIFGLRRGAELRAHYPLLDGTLWYVYLACPVAGILSTAGVWFWRRWGFLLACAGGLLVLAIELHTQGLEPHVARVPITLGILAALVRPEWGRFR